MAENIVPILIRRIEESLIKITQDFEIILVEDGSVDNSWREIEKIAKKNPRIKAIQLSRNFGQHYAITSGLDHSKGEWVVVMDCDLQDQPEEIEKLYAKAMEGFDIVLASRHKRKDFFLKKLLSKTFVKLLSYLTGYTLDPSVANFGIYSRKAVDSIGMMRESIRYFPTMVKWVGFNSTKINVDHASRLEGETSYNFYKLLRLAVDIILSYSEKPLVLLIKLGGTVATGSVIVALFYLYKWLAGEVSVLGFTSLIVSIWFLFGVVIATLGVVGLYVGKTFQGVRKRPIYIVNKIING